MPPHPERRYRHGRRGYAGGARPEGGFIPLFWRLFVPNATVLAAACVVLMLMRRAVAPLGRLMTVMEEVDPLEPGRRLEVETAESEGSAGASPPSCTTSSGWSPRCATCATGSATGPGSADDGSGLPAGA